LDHYQKLKRRDAPTINETQEWQALIETHANEFLKAYGKAFVKPKHHYGHHLPKQVIDEKFLDAFTCERKNGFGKTCMASVDNTVNFEACVFREMVCRTIGTLQATDPFCNSLLGRPKDCLELAKAFGVDDAKTATSVRLEGVQVNAKEYWLSESLPRTGNLIEACAEVRSKFLLKLQPLEHVESHNGYSSRWKLVGDKSVLVSLPEFLASHRPADASLAIPGNQILLLH
jgi:hypothetical protein